MPNPRVGIWWDTGKTIVIVAHRPTENVARTGSRLDSNLAHADQWTKVAGKLGRTTDDEYFSVPRGRVLLDVESLTGVVLHGPATKLKRLELGFGTAWRLRCCENSPCTRGTAATSREAFQGGDLAARML